MGLFWRQRSLQNDTRQIIDRLSYALAIALPTAIIIVLLAVKPIGLDTGNLVFDWYQRLKPRVWDATLPVRIVDIDDESLRRLGQWPWPRKTIAEIVGQLRNLGAVVVALDFVFAESDSSSAEQVVRSLPLTPARERLEQELHGKKSNDEILSAAIAEIPTVLGTVLTQAGPHNDFPGKFGIATAGDDPRLFIPHFTSAVVPLPILSASAGGIGALNWLPDRDQIVRRVPLVLSLGDKIVPSLALETLRVAQGASNIIIRSSNASGQTAFGAHTGVNAVKVGDIEIPSDAQGEVRVRYTASEARRFIPAWMVLAGLAKRADFEGRIVIIGTSAAGLADQRGTSIDASVPGVEIQVQVIEQAVSGAWLQRPDWARGAELVLAVLLALCVGFLIRRVSALSGAVAVIATVVAICWTSWHQFSANSILLDSMIPALSVALSYGSGTVWLYRQEQRRRRYLREAFSRYVSPALANKIAEGSSQLVLGGQIRTLTIMFCDVRGFTGIAERLDAGVLTQFMNEYLTAMTEVVLANGGTIDKYIGDAIMAFWNAPLEEHDHANRAARTALAMTDVLASLNKKWRTAGAPYDIQGDIKFGIGLATGDCCVGNFGSLQRFNYSAIGDRVNLAARLEKATKIYRTDILASQLTRDLSPNLAWLEVDELRMKGKSEVTPIYALAGDDIERASPRFDELARIHESMIASFRKGDFNAAARGAEKARMIAADRLSELYMALVQRYRLLAQAGPDRGLSSLDPDKD